MNSINTLNRDRNTLKRLVESYGKKDVLNFVRHLNESSSFDLTSEEQHALINSIDFFIYEQGYDSFYAEDDDFGGIEGVEIVNNKLVVFIDGPAYDIREISDRDICLLRFLKSNPKDEAIVKSILERVNGISAVIDYQGDPNDNDWMEATVLDLDYDLDETEKEFENNPSASVELQTYAANKFGSW